MNTRIQLRIHCQKYITRSQASPMEQGVHRFLKLKIYSKSGDLIDCIELSLYTQWSLQKEKPSSSMVPPHRDWSGPWVCFEKSWKDFHEQFGSISQVALPGQHGAVAWLHWRHSKLLASSSVRPRVRGWGGLLTKNNFNSSSRNCAGTCNISSW